MKRFTDPIEIPRAERERGIHVADVNVQIVEQRSIGNVDQTLNEGIECLRVLMKGRGSTTPFIQLNERMNDSGDEKTIYFVFARRIES